MSSVVPVSNLAAMLTSLSSSTVTGNGGVVVTGSGETIAPICCASRIVNVPGVTMLGPVARGPRWSLRSNDPVRLTPRALPITVAAGFVAVGSTKTAASVLMQAGGDTGGGGPGEGR